MSILASSHWLVAVPNELGSAKTTADRFRTALSLKGNVGEVSPFEVPAMKVGTLDSLLSLADDLARADAFAEGVVRKVERQIAEAHTASKLADLAKAGVAAGGEDRDRGAAAIAPLEFRAGGLPVAEYVKKFTWDSEQYDAKVRTLGGGWGVGAS